MTQLRHRSVRAAWSWCLLYTCLVPAPARDRRRTEVLGHLYESELAGLRPSHVVTAAVRGAWADAIWSVRRSWRPLVTAPGTWVALAAALPVAALVVGTFGSSSTAGDVEGVALIGSLTLLVMSGLLALRRRG